MSRQTFFFSSKFNKKQIYDLPNNKYQEFTNVYIYSIMVKISNYTPNCTAVCHEVTNEWNNVKKESAEKIDDIIQDYMATPLNLYDIQSMKYKHSAPMMPIEKSNPLLPTIHSVNILPEILTNASAQRKAADAVQTAEKKLYEFEQIYNITSDAQIRNDIYQKIENLQNEIKSNKDKITKLKRNAKYTQNCREKKLKLLIENEKIVCYDKPEKPSFLFKHPDLHDRIHDCIEFGSADAKR